jgi:hypothetical protein
MNYSKTVADETSLNIELDNLIDNNLDPNCKKMIEKVLSLQEKYKVLNEELKEIIQFEKEIKTKEINNESKKVEMLNYQMKINEKDSR